MTTRTSKATGLSLVLLALSAVETSAGPKEGQALATRWCASCHVVAADQASATEGVPSFATIAATRDDAAIAGFLFDPHPTMRGLALSREEIADVVAYIKSLKL
jgi:mono/diheme cytochrome c family protein